jgi:hypothetical protein
MWSIVGFITTGYVTAAAGWYMALSGTAASAVALVGGAVAALLIPRFIAPPVGFAVRGSAPGR